MILHHVAQRSRVVVIAAAVLDAHRFGHGDGHIVNAATVPDWLEKRIGKAECQNVLHRFLAQIMINPENLGFLEIGGEDGIQGQGGFQVIADWFLHHNPCPFPVARQSGFAEVFWDFAEHARRCGHVKDAVGFGAPFLFQSGALGAQSRIGLWLFEITLLVADVLGEFIPGGVLRFAKPRELIDAVMQPLTQLFVAHGNAIHRDDREISGHASVLGEVEQGWHKFAPSQITGSAKNDKYRRFELVVRLHGPQVFAHSV